MFLHFIHDTAFARSLFLSFLFCWVSGRLLFYRVCVFNMLSGGAETPIWVAVVQKTLTYDCLHKPPGLVNYSPASDRLSLWRCSGHLGSSWGHCHQKLPSMSTLSSTVIYWHPLHHCTQVPAKSSEAIEKTKKNQVTDGHYICPMTGKKMFNFTNNSKGKTSDHINLLNCGWHV